MVYSRKKLLQDLQSKLESQLLDPYKPSGLINQAVYSQLPENKQGMCDMTAINLCSKIRQIKDLMQLNSASDCFHLRIKALDYGS